MATPSLFRAAPLVRLHLYLSHHSIPFSSLKPSWFAEAPSAFRRKSSSSDNTTVGFSVRDPPKYTAWTDSDFRKWRDKEAEILNDIQPVISLAKEILHSDRYLDGEQLNDADEKVVTEKLLAYHPNAEDKIGCGIDSIMVDRHPRFTNSRCLFVVRTDGGWIDFSYQKCLRAYIREKYPSYAERFIREHFKRGS